MHVEQRPPSGSDTLGLEGQYLIRSYSHSIVIDRGEGCYMYDAAGNRYLDFMSGIGVNALSNSVPSAARRSSTGVSMRPLP